MPKIDISDATMKRLKANAEPLVDTNDSIINTALDALESLRNGKNRKQSRRNFNKSHQQTELDPLIVQRNSNLPEMEIDAQSIPNVTHTRILYASINGEELNGPKWGTVLQKLYEIAIARNYSVLEINTQFSTRIVSGYKNDNGYIYSPDSKISTPPLSAKEACKLIVRIASKLGLIVNIDFEWLAKPDAEHPGRKAKLRI